MNTKRDSIKSGASVLSKLNEDQTDKAKKKPKADDSGSTVLSKLNDDPEDQHQST